VTRHSPELIELVRAMAREDEAREYELPRSRRLLAVYGRYWKFVDAESHLGGCWLWTGSKTNGYGCIMLRKGRSAKATHLALEFVGKPRPEGAFALHSCDNPACVNPAHLRWGTHAENMNDMKIRGRRLGK
jgi:hypothetical protein